MIAVTAYFKDLKGPFVGQEVVLFGNIEAISTVTLNRGTNII